ncbi:hypothetical protein IC229_26870 [Spirosoma sp. BT702]|uniref:Uncharacterized protein n=1 Tax=Spirosoma profusum TaxID=2771354 RepID=A0A926Y1H7_9BACT|nr:hypothetical protein [Spirosoma profusum]MBD2704296.1 hypothetical protein [Spirosoma profusum]
MSECTSRFSEKTKTIFEAKEQIFCRSKQLLKFNYKLDSLREFDWGIIAYFQKGNETYQFFLFLEQYKNTALLEENLIHTVLITDDCRLDDYLAKNNINYVAVTLSLFREYELISAFYGAQKAQRSGVYLMNHIDEGLFILEKIQASDVAKKAYCLHPIIQSDEALQVIYTLLKGIDTQVIIALTEYRSVANEYLSKRKIKSIDEIRLSPLKDVNDMLIADKIQNKKDFELYHKKTHPRSAELTEYFDNWLRRLGVAEEFYTTCATYCQ